MSCSHYDCYRFSAIPFSLSLIPLMFLLNQPGLNGVASNSPLLFILHLYEREESGEGDDTCG